MQDWQAITFNIHMGCKLNPHFRNKKILGRTHTLKWRKSGHCFSKKQKQNKQNTLSTLLSPCIAPYSLTSSQTEELTNKVDSAYLVLFSKLPVIMDTDIVCIPQLSNWPIYLAVVLPGEFPHRPAAHQVAGFLKAWVRYHLFREISLESLNLRRPLFSPCIVPSAYLCHDIYQMLSFLSLLVYDFHWSLNLWRAKTSFSI